MSPIKSVTSNKGNGYDERDYQWLMTRRDSKYLSTDTGGNRRGFPLGCITENRFLSYRGDCSRIYEFISRGIVSANAIHVSYGVHIKYHPLMIARLEQGEHSRLPSMKNEGWICLMRTRVPIWTLMLLLRSSGFFRTINRFLRASCVSSNY